MKATARLLSLFVIALTISACDMMQEGTPTGPTPTTPANVVSYTAIGASDAIGFGSSVPCFIFTPCPDGMGYVQLLAKRLKSDGKTVSMLNLGLPGGVLSPEIQAIGNALGRDVLSNFLDQEVPFVALDATLVTVFAGGNDVNTVGAALKAGYGGVDPIGYRNTRVTNFRRDLRAMMAGIKARAPQARVVVLNLPNLAGLPYAAGLPVAEKRVLQQIAVAFSAEINSLRASDNALVIDVMCDPEFYQPNAYSNDGFHPNDTGYAHLASVMYTPATIGSAPAPRSSCSQMTLY